MTGTESPLASPSHVVALDPDHPGFWDPAYRTRRNEIAEAALRHRPGELAPRIAYTNEEHETWAHVWSHLEPLHAELACREIQALRRGLPLSPHEIPQLEDLNPILGKATGFRMDPVAGLVTPRTFLSRLGERVFLATQYVRHPSRPLYTPEPDVIHELVGHAFTLCDPRVAELNVAFGQATLRATTAQVMRLESVYWYSLEFGAAMEDDEPRAVGAGLLSSAGELARFRDGVELVGWDLDWMAGTPYDPTAYQPCYFVAESFEDMLADLTAWLSSGAWR